MARAGAGVCIGRAEADAVVKEGRRERERVRRARRFRRVGAILE